MQLQRRRVIDDGACAAIADAVLAERAHWTRRGATSEFYTLGAASYLDVGDAYRALAERTGPLLRERFAPLYAALCEQLAALLARPVQLARDHAVPGFHVWGVPGIPTDGSASLHFDLQYERLAWPHDADLAEPLSFTLPLRLPRRGSGLTVWDLTRERVDEFYARTAFRGSLADLARLVPERFEPYACGELVAHAGHVLHRIGPTPAVEPDDLRITLQGHGVLIGGCWHLYW